MKKWQKISWYWFEEIIIKDSKVQSTMNLKKKCQWIENILKDIDIVLKEENGLR